MRKDIVVSPESEELSDEQSDDGFFLKIFRIHIFSDV